MKPTKLGIYGTVQDGLPPDLAAHAGGLNITPRFGAELSLGRAESEHQVRQVSPGDLVELDLGNDVHLWTSVDKLAEDETIARSDSHPDLLQMPSTLSIGRAERAGAGLIIKALKVFGIDPVDDIVDFVKTKVEGNQKPGQGLFRCAVSDDPEHRLVDQGRSVKEDPDKRILLLLHGTASSAQASFGGIWDSGRMARALDRYSDVLAFQHRTLSDSPLRNTIDLLSDDGLPTGARLHLVSHSRGGLIGDLLCRGRSDGVAAFDPLDFMAFRDDQQAAEDLRLLDEALGRKQIVVERFVRTASPSRGTTLAGGRLDRYLSVIVNVLRKLTGDPFILDAFTALMLGVIKARTDPQELPGLAAMMPKSPLIKMLNRPDRKLPQDLYVVGGDIKGEGALGNLKALTTDIFFREDHDLVVNTPSMLGGGWRSKPVRYWIDEGGNVNHFGYFRKPETAAKVEDALLGTPHAGFHDFDRRSSGITDEDYRKRAAELGAAAPRPTLLFLPGMMGSTLAERDGSAVWLDMSAIALGKMAETALDGAVLTATEPLNGYQPLLSYLAESHKVVPVPYDWRRSYIDSGKVLLEALKQALPEAEANRQPIRILAHSTGGLAFRAMLTLPGAQSLWSRACALPGSRVILLGTPTGGTHTAAALLMGRDPLISKLAMIDLRHSYSELLGLFAGFPGIAELLPGEEPGFLSPGAWEVVKPAGQPAGTSWAPPSEKNLKSALANVRAFRAAPLDPTVSIYVAGVAPATPVDIRTDPNTGQGAVVLATEFGDGRVTWKTGIPPELLGANRVWYADALHGDLASDPEYFPALLDLLDTGTTSKLPQAPPARRRAAGETFPMPDETPETRDMYPDYPTVAAAALGGSLQPRSRKGPRVRVTVKHADLTFAGAPVAVGHYQGDPLLGAERQLDQAMQGRLSERMKLGVYPGPAGTAVFLRPAVAATGAHPGAVVIGLGGAGTLSPGNLERGFVQGSLLYMSRLLEERAARPPEDAENGINATIASLLIGTSTGGLELADALKAILGAVKAANLKLGELVAGASESGVAAGRALCRGNRDRLETLRIAQLELIELQEDRAIQALKTLKVILRASDLGEHFEAAEYVVPGRGGRRRMYFHEDRAWWLRLRITVDADETLKFETFTERARVESNLLSTQRTLVEGLLAQARGRTSLDTGLSYTLFDLLVPNSLKERVPENRDLVMVLDEKSAAYPWELMHNRNGSLEPPAVAAGMVRQLTTVVHRKQVVPPAGNKALVVGDPKNDDKRFPLLQGARDEANLVANLLESRQSEANSVTRLIGQDATPGSVVHALYANDYRIVHLAAHGVVDFDPVDAPPSKDPCEKRPTITGMALGKEIFLTSAEIEQMRSVPDLVFVNCCHLGSTTVEGSQPRYHQLAANLATQLIRIGVRAVIAAGWAVDDQAAMVFARTFYEGFLNGVTFGEAVRVAREETYHSHPNVNTWGAYQCYGSPDFALEPSGPVDDYWTSKVTKNARPDFVSPRELVLALEDVALRNANSWDDICREQEIWLKTLVDQAPADWFKLAEVREALGLTYGELGIFDQAVEHLEAVLCVEPAEVRLKSLERLAEFRLNWALELLDKAAADNKLRTLAEKQVKAAEDEIKRLLQFCKSRFRLGLKGRLQGMKALLRDPAKRPDLLLEAAAAYAEADNIPGPVTAGLAESSEAFINLLAIRIVLSRDEVGPEVTRGLERLDRIVQSGSTDVLSAAMARFLRGLVFAGARNVDETLACFTSACNSRASYRDLVRAADEIRFVTRLVKSVDQQNAPLVAFVDSVKTGLDGCLGDAGEGV